MTTISYPGGSVVYITDTGSTISYKLSSGSSFVPITWPCTISNLSPSDGFVIIEFISDITFSSGDNQYFVCGSEKIQFGSTSLKEDGTRPIITINGISNYPGLVRNGTASVNGQNDIYVFNLEVHTVNSATLETAGAEGGGWIAQKFFSRGASDNYIVNCHSTGEIAENAGGIVGSFAGSYGGDLTVIGCSSSGLIRSAAGGICGLYAGIYYAGVGTGNITCESCWSIGDIISSAGGIIGANAGIATVTNCYSSGEIYGGGICGAGGGLNGNVIITSCYSTGIINGSSSGGIAGLGARTITITNCYTSGNVTEATASGIIGGSIFAGTKTITNCYATGTVNDANGYIASDLTIVNGTSGNFVLSNNYSEAANSSSGWNTTNAVTVLTDTPSPIIGTIWTAAGLNQPFELTLMGYRPYSLQNITTNPSPSLIRTSFGTSSAGGTTDAAIVSGKSYTILQTPSGTESITIDSTTGVISTTTATPAGVYLIWIRNTGSYNITVYELTVTGGGGGDSGGAGSCCASRAALRGVDYTTRASVLAGNAMIAGRMSTPMSHSDYLRIKKAKAFRY